MRSNAFVNFDFNFSPISVEYEEGSENFLEFLTFILGLVGGLLGFARIINALVNVVFSNRKQGYKEVEIPTTNE